MTLFSTRWHRNFVVLVLICICSDGSAARQNAQENEQNEAFTESTPRVTTNSTAGLTTVPEEASFELEQPRKTSDILNLGCAGIRIRRYVSNGFCTSRRPIRDTICDGECVAMDELPWFPDYSKIISRHKREWRCVADETRSKKVTVHCNDGTKRRYEVRVVRSCKCKRYTHKQNQTNPWYTVAALFTNNKEQKSTMKNRCQKAYPQRWTANIPSLCSFRM